MPLRFQLMVVYYGVLTPFQEPRPVRHSADRVAAERYARENNGHITEHYWEEGRTRRSTRPKLVEALDRAKDATALLIIPRFEPLARDPVFLTLLWESGVDFIACDNAYANQTTLPLLASIVQKDSAYIAARTRIALAKRTRRHQHLGSPHNLTQEARVRGAQATKTLHSTKLDAKVQDHLLALRDQGKSLRQIAAVFNQLDYHTKTGRPWSHTVIKRLLDRHGKS